MRRAEVDTCQVGLGSRPGGESGLGLRLVGGGSPTIGAEDCARLQKAAVRLLREGDAAGANRAASAVRLCLCLCVCVRLRF